MADEIPPAPSESEDASKAETIRITLPPRQEQQAVKRETVRINLPGKPSTIPPLGSAPKKESTKLGGGDETATDLSATVSKPFLTPPPKPPSAPSTPGIPAAKPLAGTTPPKPPSFGARPTVPLKPAPPAGPGLGAGPTPAPAPSPLAQKAAAPKKETARITLPPEGGAKPALPKATVKMQQTQPLVNRSAPMLTPSAPSSPHNRRPWPALRRRMVRSMR